MRKVLIANRGEIAVRITKTLQQMGLIACAVYSDADALALHALEADEAYALPGVTPLETYLNQDLVLEIAARHGIDAIHPGYGFLSENAAFARRCAEAGITFIGPPPDVVDAMGDKLHAKETMRKAGVPTVPSFQADGGDLKTFLRGAAEVGYPLLVKAAAGGGGKGMRRVDDAEDLPGAIQMARGEARKAFGDDRVFLERYIARPRHVEIQIFGDQHGNVVHLGERECSIQRRYQKIIEESPSPAPAMTEELRARMGEAAVKAAKALGYTNAGTVEFLLDDDGSFYFLEVNTRLQVEHPVTEMAYGFDLVRAQVEVAQGKPLPFRQEQLVPRGWAMECRLYAEDPANNYLPSIGKLEVFRPPSGPGIRVDSGVQQGDRVTIHYDPMLAKLITWGAGREEARQRMVWALERFAVLGVSHNLEFLRRVLEQPEFVAGKTHTHFLQEHPLSAHDPAELPEEVVELAALAQPARRRAENGAAAPVTPWEHLSNWRQSR